VTSEVTPDRIQKLRDMGEELTTIYVVDLCDKQGKTMPTFSGQSIDLIESIKKVGKGLRPETGELDGVTFKAQQKGGDLYKFMVNLRFFLPEIFASELLPETLRDIDYFLWLDSDLLVYKNLSDLWGIAREHPHQQMFGANLLYGGANLGHNPDRIGLREVYGIGLGFAISGGVVLWNVRQIIKDCLQINKNVFV
jgi:lipopolysaccharide biosynthesis glycosyltransferase